MRSYLYNCTVKHKRTSPKVYGFSSSIFMWMVDLDELPQISKALPFFSHNKSNIYSFRDSDHLYLGKPSLKENVSAYLKENGFEQSPSRVRILTNLRTFGYVFNPVSFIFCEDEQRKTFAVIAEVHNTYGELKPFIVHRQDNGKSTFESTHPKHFYISPFSHLDHELKIRLGLTGDKMGVVVSDYNKGEKRPFLRASLVGRRKPLSNLNVILYTLRFPLVTLRIIAEIHYHALRLYLKKVPFYTKKAHPELQKNILAKNPSNSLT